MTRVRVVPGVVFGTVRAPPSKSYTHRALVAGHFSGRPYAIQRPLDADDTRATARALDALGSRVRIAPHRWTVSPRRGPLADPVSVECGESGTTLRFIAAVAARSGRTVRLRGRGRLPARPIAELLQALRSLGARCQRPGGPRALPLDVRGPLHSGTVRLDASRSSQFVSALLLTLPTIPGDSTVDLVGTIVSEPYIEATEQILRYHHVRVHRRGRRFSIPGGQSYRGRGISVPGDASSAAYLWTAAAITGGRVRVTGVPSNWPQADLAVLDLLRSAGAAVRRSSDGATVEGGILRAFRADLTRSPDLYPLAGVLASSIDGESRVLGASHVVHKESDRRRGTIALSRALGAEVRRGRNGLAIRGTARPTRFHLRGLDDHRLVMSAAVGALVGDGPSTIEDARAVDKSFPAFWSVLAGLRSEVVR